MDHKIHLDKPNEKPNCRLRFLIIEFRKLNFFSAGPTSWDNSQADESDNLAWSESEAEEPKAPSTKEALPSGKRK